MTYKKEVIVIIPVHSEDITYYEEISLRQCFKVLKRHPIRLLYPKGLNIKNYKKIIHDIRVDFIDPKWQTTYRMYNRLKISKFFYEKYIDYKYLLTYELDSFVFKDELLDWCNNGYDYIGAPWIKGHSKANEDSLFTGVGNSGFSLRNTNNCLLALTKFSYIEKPQKLIDKYIKSSIKLKVRTLPGLIKKFTIGNNTYYLFNDFAGHEDAFWCKPVKNNFKWFNIADVNDAIKFSFELQPHRLYRINNQNLPFGCHAWWKYDINFWKPFIEAEGYKL